MQFVKMLSIKVDPVCENLVGWVING